MILILIIMALTLVNNNPILKFRRNRSIRCCFFVWLLILYTSHISLAQTNTRQSIDYSGTLVLDYQDFGPQVIAHQILGMEWWLWESYGDSNPETKYPISVVVYRGISLKAVKKLYPVDPDKFKDYRYVLLCVSLEYLEQEIKNDILPQTTRLLKATRHKLIFHFKK